MIPKVETVPEHHKGRVHVKVLAQIFEDLDLDHRRVAVLWDVPHHLDRHPAILLRAGVSAPTRDQTQRARSGPGECRSTARPSRRCLPPHGSVKDQRQREREAAQWPHAPVPSCFSTLSAQEATGAQRGQQREGLRTTAARGGGAGAEGAHSGPRAFRPSPRGSAPPRRKTSWQGRRPQRRCPRAISAGAQRQMSARRGAAGEGARRWRRTVRLWARLLPDRDLCSRLLPTGGPNGCRLCATASSGARGGALPALPRLGSMIVAPQTPAPAPGGLPPPRRAALTRAVETCRRALR